MLFFYLRHLCSTYLSTYNRSNLKGFLDRVVKDSDNVIVNRGNGSVVVIMSQPDIVEAIRQGDEDVKKGNYEIVDVDEL